MGAIEFKGRSIKVHGPVPTEEMQLLRAEVREGFGKATEIDLEFMSTKIDLDLDKVLGKPVTIEIETEENGKRYFAGHAIEVVFEGIYQGQGHYVASLRSWNWFLTRTTDSRIFQDKSAIEIIKEIFADHGFNDFKDETTQTFPKRVYCVQYRETDHDFVHRLMVEEGIYYFFDYEMNKDTLVMIDSASKHKSIEERSDIDFFFKEDGYRRRDDHVFDWRERESLRSGTVTLDDYDHTKPSSDLTAAKTMKKGSHSHNGYEIYDHPGRYDETSRGETFARIRAEAFVSEFDRSRGIANVRTMACGYRFKLQNHPRTSANQEYLVIEAIHQLQIETDYDKGELGESALGERVVLDLKKNKDPYRVTFRAQPATVEYRSPHPCPRPVIPGLQTAVVTGPKGKEIYTDKYGRVKVQFHWDREGKKDEKTTCWIRKAEPWTGKKWGMVWVPRIGQEVVVQFEEGDPDRPMIVGMLYNEDFQHPYTLDANMTMMGWTTRSTEKGKTDTFHELVFEDKIEKEYVRFQSERDYKQIVKNNAEITVGLEHKDKGDMTITIHNDRTETVKEGDHTFKVEKGKETYEIKKDRDVKVGDNHTEDVGKNQDVSIGQNQTVDVGQNITIEAGTKITLKVGGTSIVMDAMGITLKASNIKNDAQMNFEAKGGIGAKMEGKMTAEVKGNMSAKLESSLATEVKGTMTTVKGDGMLTAKGGITMIN